MTKPAKILQAYEDLDPQRFMNSLLGKTVLVTGAGRGIGKEIAIAFSRAGCNVACVARTEAEINSVAELINSSENQSQAKAFTCDVSDIDSLSSLIGDIRRWIDRPIEILINNAGEARIEAIEYQHDMNAWNRIIATNLTAPVALSYQLIPDMIINGNGVIISIGSRNAVAPIPYMSAYSVSKTGLLRFHENMQVEMRGKSVYNYYVVPGNVQTTILDGEGAKHEESVDKSNGASHMVDMIEKCAKVPPDTVANMCVFLVAEKNATCLSGRYVDTEGDLGELLEEIKRGKENRCVTQGLYKLGIKKL